MSTRHGKRRSPSAVFRGGKEEEPRRQTSSRRYRGWRRRRSNRIVLLAAIIETGLEKNVFSGAVRVVARTNYQA